MHTINFLTRVIEHHQILVYAIILLIIIFEGEVVAISVGVLAHLGALHLGVALFFVFLGSFVKPFIGYAIGGLLRQKFNNHKFFDYIRKRVYTLLPRFKNKPFWSIFASKFIWGANNIAILFSGYEKINYQKFLKAEIFAILIWAPLMLMIGYIFSYAALYVSREIWKFLLVVLILFIIFILFDKLVSRIYELIEEFYDDEKD